MLYLPVTSDRKDPRAKTSYDIKRRSNTHKRTCRLWKSDINLGFRSFPAFQKRLFFGPRRSRKGARGRYRTYYKRTSRDGPLEVSLAEIVRAVLFAGRVSCRFGPPSRGAHRGLRATKN
ncbi:hypothetical protein TNCT_41371 [Trichonephila clavata]|uniref:Uncharacterized protein n=1 Tax=Trichonephila clavata TaxID=2740835 RepID=A0A8X6IQ42_TRICU|nr:hypothetical protein TNCT_41371 [Trichonephila clavata]